VTTQNLRLVGHGSCRQCAVSCERVVYPSRCFDGACPRLYLHEAGGRTGVARFEVVLHRSGQVVAMKLVTSAGHPALDRAAREAIERSLPFAPFPPEVRAEAVPLIASIPVAP